MNPNKYSFCVASSLIITLLLMLAYFYLGIERFEYDDMIKVQKVVVGGIHEQGLDAAEMENVARFAIEEYTKHVNCVVEFHRLVKAEEKVMSGKMYHLTLEAKDGKSYETKVWVNPWMDFKQMQEFKLISDDDPNV